MNYGQEFKKFAVKHMGISSTTVHRVENHYEQELPQAMTRSVIEERPTNFREIDVFSRLMMDRIIFLGMAVEDTIANIICAQLLFLDNTNQKTDITMYINSPGGSVYDGYAIRDTMNLIRPDVGTICMGMAASMGAVLLCSGAPKKRLVLPYSRVMLHQPLGGMRGQASDMKISYQQIEIIKQELYHIIGDSLPKDKKKSMEQIEKDCDRDYWMRGQEAVDYGVADEVIQSKKK